MGAYLLGVLLFALGIAVTIALHELGHLLVARACGMRVRRYFIGFGPKIFSVRKNHTEYGIAAIPFGGFCEIAGMTVNDPLSAEEAPHAMINKPAWQRIAVLSGGVVMNLLLGMAIIYSVAIASGIPNPDADYTPTVGELTCTSDQDPATGKLIACSGAGPAARAGLQPGDQITAVDGEAVKTFSEFAAVIAKHPGRSVELTVNDRPVVVDVAEVTRYDADGRAATIGAVGIVSRPVADAMKQYGPVEAVPATLRLTGQTLESTVRGLANLPSKIPGVVASIFGTERDQESPMSVVGASRVGGELVERSLWQMFWMMLASLNFFLALFNLVPLPPLDGGHIIVIIYELFRDFFRRLAGKGPGPKVDYQKLMPLTYAMAAVLLVFGVLIMVADVVNPVRLFG